MNNMYSEEDLLKGIKEENEKVLSHLYSVVYPQIVAFVKRTGGNEEDGRDVFQDAYVSMIENIRNGKFNQKSKISTYLFSISKFKWYNSNKKNKNISLDKMREEVGFEPVEEEKVQDYSSEQLSMLKTAMAELKADCRRILTAMYYEKADMKKLAEEMNYTYAFIRVKKNRCMNTLKNKLKSS